MNRPPSDPRPRRWPLLDLLAQRYPECEREKLFARILCGEVFVDGALEKDPKRRVNESAELLLSSRRFVSRGGWKLDAALDAWDIPVEGGIWLDAGASTGGFTDALLQRGARLVHTVDVGTNQLDFRLRMDRRVSVHEKTNIMTLSALEPRPEGAVADLSFRSLRGAAGKILELTSGGLLIALLKPQFEAGPELGEGFRGVIEDAQLAPVLVRTLEELADEGVHAVRLLPSPIRGRRGNQEFLIQLGREPSEFSADAASGVARLLESLASPPKG